MSLANTGASSKKPSGAEKKKGSHPGATAGGAKKDNPGAAKTPLTR